MLAIQYLFESLKWNLSDLTTSLSSLGITVM
jgi:hypothetical protein